MVALDFETLLQQYRAGIRKFQNTKVEIIDSFECDLRGVEFEGVIIVSAYMPYCNLSGANLAKICIQRGNLSNARLFSANLSQAQLKEINFFRSDLQLARLEGADLRGCNLRGADLQNAILDNANLSGADLTDANLTGTSLRSTNLAGATLFRAVEVDLAFALCDRTTIMPDGHYYS